MPNLTDRQLENACRLVCAARGYKPDSLTPDKEIMWTTFKREIIERHRVLQVEDAIKKSLE